MVGEDRGARRGAGGSEGHELEGLNSPSLASKIEERSHEPGNMGGLWKLRTFMADSQEGNENLSPTAHMELTPASNLHESGRSPATPRCYLLRPASDVGRATTCRTVRQYEVRCTYIWI